AEIGAAAAASALLPVAGPAIAIGIVGGVLLSLSGAAVGGALENALESGLPKDELFVYEEALRRGYAIVVVTPTDADGHERAGAGGERARGRARERARVLGTREDPQLEPSGNPGSQDARRASDTLERLRAAGPVFEHEAPVHEVQHPVDQDRGDEDVVQVAQHGDEVRDQVEGRDEVEDGGGEHDLGGLRQHRVDGEAADRAHDVRQRAQERLHGSRLSATSSLTSFTASVSSAPFTLRPRSIIARQNGQPVPTRSTFASRASSTRIRFTRFSAFTSIHMWPPPPPQQRPR